MAFQTGIAADHNDLWSKLLDFLTADPALFALGQHWTIPWQGAVGSAYENDVVLCGPGLGGDEQIYIGLRRNDFSDVNAFHIRMVGMTGIVPTAEQFDQHVNVSTRHVCMFIDNHPMTYWFVANGRRFVVVVKISTVYEAMYGGLYLPYADPITYPYPLFIGGSFGPDADSTLNWTNTATSHRHFVDNRGMGTAAYEYPNRYSSAYFLDPAAQWWPVNNSNIGTPNTTIAPWQWLGDLGTITDVSRQVSAPWQIMHTISPLGGGQVLHPATLVRDNPSDQTFGVLDGVFHVPGEGNAAENTVTLDGVDHLVIQNVWRTDELAYWALALEP